MQKTITCEFKFEQKAYNEDATANEIQAIKNQVFVHSEGVVFLKEIPEVSPFSINLVFDEIERLGQQMGRHGIVIDIRETRRPNTETRRVINTRFTKICERVEHVSFCTGQNILINTAVRFVMYQTNLDSFSIHKTVEASINAIKEKLNG